MKTETVLKRNTAEELQRKIREATHAEAAKMIARLELEIAEIRHACPAELTEGAQPGSLAATQIEKLQARIAELRSAKQTITAATFIEPDQEFGSLRPRDLRDWREPGA